MDRSPSQQIRDDLDLRPGSKVLFVKLGEHGYRMIARTGKIKDLAGMLHRPGQRALTGSSRDLRV